MKLYDFLEPFDSDINFSLFLLENIPDKIGIFTKMDKGLKEWLDYEVKLVELVGTDLFISIGGKK